MVTNKKITFVMGVSNEEGRVELALRNVHGWGEIVVIDNFSTDRTVDIVRRYTDRVYQYKNPGHLDNEEGFDFICSKVETPWMFRLCAGEAVPRALLEMLVKIAEEDRYSVVCIGRKSISYGRDTHNWMLGHNPRFHKKGAVTYKGAVIHTIGTITVPPRQVLYLPHADDLCFWQFRDYTASRTEQAHNVYLDQEVQEHHKLLKRKFSPLRLLLGSAWVFFTMYVRRAAFLKGWPAFFVAVWGSMYMFNPVSYTHLTLPTTERV